VQVSATPSSHSEFHEPVGNVFNAHNINQYGAPKWPTPLELCAERHDWTDRVKVLEELAQHLASPEPHPVLISGPEGAGKTALVAVAAARARKQ
jgi:Holliday junction resolvasome RuvABC ATP-dependent DNA helicase subunit